MQTETERILRGIVLPIGAWMIGFAGINICMHKTGILKGDDANIGTSYVHSSLEAGGLLYLISKWLQRCYIAFYINHEPLTSIWNWGLLSDEIDFMQHLRLLSAGYFVYDLLDMIRLGTHHKNFPIIGHHLGVILVLLSCLVLDKFHFLNSLMLFAEFNRYISFYLSE